MVDPIIQTKVCPISGEQFTITQSDLDFYDKVSPTFAGQKFAIPTPTLSPTERQRRRLSFRNERHLYRRKCDASGKDIISIYSPDKPYKVYDQKIRRSDSRDPLSYGQDFDFSKTFTENFKELMKKVPQLGLLIINPENSDYTNGGVNNKNCYLIFLSSYNEYCLYCKRIFNSQYLVDCSHVYDSSYCYGLNKGNKCFKCYNSINLQNCSDCQDCYNLISCSFCIGCDNLENKSYCIDNKQYTKEEYNAIKKDYYPLNHTNHSIDIPNIQCDYCSGMELENCNNTNESYRGTNAKDAKYCYDFSELYDSEDVSYQAYQSSLCYECVGIEQANSLGFSMLSTNISNSYYSYCCFNSSCLFGCIGLRNKSYCIFNKQYTKEEYELTVSKIISHMMTTGEWGEFFHPSLSPFGYNETVAQEYYPVASSEFLDPRTEHLRSKNQDLRTYGYHRSDYQSPTPLADKIIEGKDLPDTIEEVADDILKTAIKCEVTGKLFRVIPQELAFYRKHHIPIPRRHPDQRHLDRLALRQ